MILVRFVCTEEDISSLGGNESTRGLFGGGKNSHHSKI